jgi:hypothetical protein
VAELSLPSGPVALIDDEDWPLVKGYRWFAMPARRTIYVAATPYRDGRTTTVRLHRLLMAPGPGLWVDHINGDGLDNRRANLRAVTRGQNAINRRTGTNNTSGFKGVSWHPEMKRWRADISVGGKRRHLGTFARPEEAAAAYNAAALTAWGPLARLNTLEEK